MSKPIKLMLKESGGVHSVEMAEDDGSTLAGCFVLDRKSLNELLTTTIREESLRIFKELKGESVLRSRFDSAIEKETHVIRAYIKHWVEENMRSAVKEAVEAQFKKMAINIDANFVQAETEAKE